MSHRNPGVLGIWGDKGTRVVASESTWREPLKWDRAAREAGERRRVFCASLADVFEGWQGQCVDSAVNPMWVNDEGYWSRHRCTRYDRPLTLDGVRARLFRLIIETKNLDWLVLSKRPQNALTMMVRAGLYAVENPTLPCPQKNLWIGASVEDQATADERIPHLLAVPATVRFLSCEPLLGPVNIYKYLFDSHPHREHWPHEKRGLLHWVIGGFEGGPKARPGHPDWARRLRNDCLAAGTAWFWEQNGEWLADGQAVPMLVDAIGGKGSHVSRALFPDGSHLPDLTGRGTNGDGAIVVRKVGKKAAGRLLDGREWSEFPEVANHA